MFVKVYLDAHGPGGSVRRSCRLTSQVVDLEPTA